MNKSQIINALKKQGITHNNFYTVFESVYDGNPRFLLIAVDDALRSVIPQYPIVMQSTGTLNAIAHWSNL